MRLSLEQIIEFQTKGFVIAEGVLSEEDLQPVIEELTAVIDARAEELFKQGKLTDLHQDAPFETRYLQLYRQCPEIGLSFDIMDIRGKALFGFLNNKNLLDVVECLLGSELSCNPIQHLRAKLPAQSIEGRVNLFENVPWHQDAGVTLEEADASEIITFWIPLVNATAETGCMELMPGVFKKGLLTHQAEGGTTIVPALLPQVEPIKGECRKGGIVIMNKYTPHRGTSNNSNMIRWTLDLRYHKTGAASGRPFHPSFVVRSVAHPESVLGDHTKWSQLWEEALLPSEAKKMHRV